MKVILLLLMLVSSVGAQTTATPLTFYQSQFGGIDNYHDSARIDNMDFQDARNVLTDRGFLEKRPGSIRVVDEVLTGYPVLYSKEFVTQANVKYLLLHSSQTLYATTFDGNVPVAIATVNVNSVMDSVSAYDKHFFTNGYDASFYYDGASIVTVSSMPMGKYIEFAYERVWEANVPGYESTLYASAFGDYTDWTIPGSPLPADSPTSFTFDQQDGNQLTGIFYSPYGILVFKRNKTFVLKGQDNDNFKKYRISDNIGCVDDRSVQLVDGVVLWLGEKGVYKWAGGLGEPEIISRDIDETIKDVQNIISRTNARVITSPTDFAQGQSTLNSPSYSWSSSIVAGSLVPSTWSSTANGIDWSTGTLSNIDTFTALGSAQIGYEDFEDLNYTANPIWTTTSTAVQFTSTGGALQNIGNLTTGTMIFTTSTQVTDTFSFNWYVGQPTGVGKVVSMGFYISSVTLSSILAQVGQTQASYAITYYQDILGYSSIDLVAWPGTGSGSNICSTSTLVTTAIQGSTYTVTLVRTDTTFVLNMGSLNCTGTTIYDLGISKWFIANLSGGDSIDNFNFIFKTTAAWLSPIFDTTFSTPIGGALTFSETVPTGSTIAYSVRESSTDVLSTWSDWVLVSTTTSGAFRIPFTKRYWQEQVELTTSYSTQTPSVQLTSLNAVSTGTWDSHVMYLGTALTSWGQFNAAGTFSPSNAVSFYTRASTSSFTVGSSTPSWVLQSNGINVACSTGTYMQVRAISAVGSSTDSATINSFTINWYEGETRQVASIFYDGRYYLAVNTSTSATKNTLVIVYQRNKKWTFFDGLSLSTLNLYDLKPYAGSGFTDSKIWRIMNEGTYYDDNNVAINAYAITKDFQFDGQNNNKILRNFYVESYPNVSGVLSMAYSIDKSTVIYTSTQNVTAASGFNDEIKGMFPGFAKGRYFRFKFSNAILNEYLKLDAYTVFGEHEKLYRR